MLFFIFDLLSYDRGFAENEKPTIGTRPVAKQLKRNGYSGMPHRKQTGAIAEPIGLKHCAGGAGVSG
jgi:hypothetical protein